MASARPIPRILAAGLVVAGLLGVALLMWVRSPERPAPPLSEPRARVGASVPEAERSPLAVRTSSESSAPERPGWMPAELRLSVRTDSGEPIAHARVESDCGWAARVDAQGEWVQLLPGGLCTVRAVREDGLLRVLSDPAEVRLEPGALVQMSLVLPDEPQGGIGIAVAPHREGVRVRAVRPSSPAVVAGVEVGAVIVEVNGIATSGWQAQDFADAVIGPLGTPVVLSLLGDDTGGDREVVLTRIWLPPGAAKGTAEGVSLSSLSDSQRREVASIRDELAALDDGGGLDPDSPQVRRLVDRVKAIAASVPED